ncbi:MAG: T9SS type A sorting domain-containing protein [Bacteroidales bacterium]|nr:T9SS type A sorting domain-containing protein [Bacteroidales bacterium]MCF8344040.1 T9SS type A sorting domain-containing protein [Bacteroidales bacterium]MCF8351589.1 T9SS type A sorting domain-containing protein [Bacteroidales bacterium]MCF8377750.1 T9SS type A sorting domain-containing protein [Bacteroidales bacterium]
MKRIITFISLLLFLSWGASAQTLSTTTFSTGNGNLPDVGDNFAIPVNVTDIGFMFTLTIYIDYDPEVLEYTDFQNGSVSGITVTNPASNILKVLVGNFPDSTEIPDGKLVDLMFDFIGGDSDFDFRTTSSTTYKSKILETDYSTFFFTDSDVTNGGVFGGEVDNTITGGDWNTATNWSQGVVPNSWHNVTIGAPVSRAVVTTSADATADDVVIENGGEFTLSNTLTVDNNFTIESGGSYIENGTLTVGGTKSAERYIEAATWTAPLDGWHLLSSPVASQSISGSFVPASGGDYDFYRWNEPTQTWENQKNPAHSFTNFVKGKGYLVAYQDSDTKVFTGSFNKSNENRAITDQGSGSSAGFNLLGNPFPSAIEYGDWGDNAAIAKVWNEATAGYIDVAAGGIIPAMNGFMVESEAASGSVTIPASARAHNATAWYKSGEERILLIAKDMDNGILEQQSVIKFNENASQGYDPEFDGRFLWGYAPGFYSYADETMMSTNNMPWSSDLVIPFRFETNGSTSFMIELAETLEGQDVYLRDLKTETVVKISESGTYTFTSEQGDDPARFELLFNTVGIEDNLALDAALVFSNDDQITVANVKGETQMAVLNLQGQALYETEFNSQGYTIINIDLPTGIYLVRLYNNGEAKTSKVIVK